MTELLEKALKKVAKLPKQEQDQIASALLQEIEIHPDFGVLIAAGQELYEELGVTAEDIQADRQALGLA